MEKLPTVEAQMLIRSSVETVFRAFIDPEITTKFWFTQSTGALEEGKTLVWHWEMYDFSTSVSVNKIIPDQLISVNWGEPPTTIDFIFSALADNKTYVVIKNYGYTETDEKLIDLIKDNTGGFTTVLDGLKAYLEHGLQLNLILDKFPNKFNLDEKTLKEWQENGGD